MSGDLVVGIKQGGVKESRDELRSYKRYIGTDMHA